MTSLKKLGLRGVRSYSCAAEESIEFFKPLTIIVGANGAGKTSIIESLKFVTTGSLPPLSDGGKSFVHDPKMDGTALVKAQVKLSFVTADDKTVLAIRNFQLTQKKTKREFKGMEAVLQTKDEHGRESSVSHKCADMEKLVPQLMGVSTAVLENVIFCHQEDSLWPLSDGKTLKTKFDDIFAATRYTKALENIAKLRKEKAQEIKIMEVELKAIEGNVEQAHKLEDDLESTKANIKKKTDESDRVLADQKAIEEKLARLGAKQDEIRAIQESIAALQAQKDVMIQEKTKANQRMITDYSDSDEELRSIYHNFRLTQQQLLKGIEDKANKLKVLEQECARAEDQLGKLSQDLGKLQAQETDYQRKKQELLELGNRLGGAAGAGHSQLLQTLEQAFASKRKELQTAKAAAQQLDAKWEAELTSLKERESRVATEIDSKLKLMEQCKSKRSSFVAQLQSLDSAARQLQSIQEQLKAGQAQLDTLSRTHDPETASMKSQIDAKTRTIQSNTQKLSILSAQRKQLASQAETLAQIKLKRSQLQNLLGNYSSGLETLRKELDDLRLYDAAVFPRALPSFERLKEVFQDASGAAPEYQWEKLEATLKRKMVELKRDMQQKGDQVTSSAAHVSSLQSQLRSLEAQIQTAKKQLHSNRAEFLTADLEALFSGSQADLEEEISKANKLLEKATNEQMLGSSAKLMYKRFVGIARESHKCYLCNRDFASQAEEDNFITANTDKMEKLHTADKAERAKAATKAAKARLEQVQALMPIYIASQQLQSTDIPKLESQLLQVQSDIAVAAASKSTIEGELKELKEREETYVDLLRNSGSISRMFGELQSMHGSLRSSEQKLEADARAATEAAGGKDGGKAANLELVTNEYEAIEKLNVTLQRECNALQEKLEAARSEKQKLIERVNRLKDESMQLAKIGDDKERLKQAEAENLKAYNDLKGETQALNEQIPSLKQRITDQLSRREEDRSRSAQVESQLMSDAAKMQRELDQFRTLVADVERYEKQLQDRLEMKKDLQAKKSLLDSQRSERARLQKELATDQESAAKNEKIDGDIKANLEYRERERAIVQHQKKIDERTAQLRAVSGGELLEDLRHLNLRLVRQKEKRSELRGSMHSEARMCEDIIATLTSERYRHIDDRYKTKLIDVKTHQLANADLETYHRALDRALMHYHSLKMKEINETLRDYWRTVYKGADIDEIFIVSDGAVVGTRRNYNYRVVMKQGDTELDMRGRCSAGQKVLASLLIRLALADTFCTQCAVLALDEPTTNLDHKNITAFAQALNQIIEKRRDQTNFQLIIITHDETFVDEIGKRSHAEHYYRVYKDNAQHSKIRKQTTDYERVGAGSMYMSNAMSFQYRLKIHQPPPRLVECGGEGDCLFRVAAYQVLGDKERYQEMREICAKFIEENPMHPLVVDLAENLFREFLKDVKGEQILTLEHYCAHIRAKGWGSINLELQIIANHFLQDFEVLYVDDDLVPDRDILSYPRPAPGEVRLLRGVFSDGGHVAALVPIDPAADELKAGEERKESDLGKPLIPPPHLKAMANFAGWELSLSVDQCLQLLRSADLLRCKAFVDGNRHFTEDEIKGMMQGVWPKGKEHRHLHVTPTMVLAASRGRRGTTGRSKPADSVSDRGLRLINGR